MPFAPTGQQISRYTRGKAGEGNRTLVSSLEGYSFTIKLHPRDRLSWRAPPSLPSLFLAQKTLRLRSPAPRIKLQLMKILRLIGVISASLILSARADLTIAQRIEGAGPVTQMIIKLKGTKARLEPNPKITTIVDNKTGEMLNLINDQKKVLRISSDRAKAVMEMAGKSEADTGKPELKATGRKENILGYEADEYVCETPSFKASYWISTTYPDANKILRQLQSMTPESWNIVGKGMPDYRDFPGLPLRSQINIGGKEITSTLLSIRQDALSDAEFSVPKDFEEMKMPNLDAIFGGKHGGAKLGASPHR